MKRTGPWSIEGIKPDIREAAREAARRQGLTLSEWLNDIIITEAADLGIDVDDMNSDDRLEAVAARLQQLDGHDDRVHEPRRASSAPRSERGEDDPRRFRPSRSFASDDWDGRYGRRPRERQPRMSNGQIRIQDAEALLDAAVEAFELSTARSHRQTAESVEAVTRLIKSHHRRRDDSMEVLSDIADRLSGIEIKMARPAAEEPRASTSRHKEVDAAIARRLADIEAHLAKRPTEDHHQPITNALARFEERLDSLARKEPAPAPEDTGLKRLESKLDALLRGSALSTPPASTKESGKRAWHASLEPAVTEIGQRQRLLDHDDFGRNRSKIMNVNNSNSPEWDAGERPASASSHAALHEQPRRPPKPVASSSLDVDASTRAGAEGLYPLQRDIAALGTKIENMRLQDLAKDLVKMRTEIGAMSTGLSGLAPRDSVASIEAAIRNLTNRIETSREEGIRETLLMPLTELKNDLRHSIDKIDPRSSIDGLERQIKMIGEKLEELAKSPHDPNALVHIQEQTRDIHNLLKITAARPLPFEQIERKIAALAEHIDKQKAPEHRYAAALGPDEDFLPPQNVHLDLAKVEDRLDDLARKVDAALTQRPSPIAKIDPESLEELAHALSDKFAAAQDIKAGQAAFEALQSQIAALAARPEQSGESLAALASLQNSIKDLFAYLDDTRHAANEVAQTSAASAAREAVRELIGQNGQSAANASEDSMISLEELVEALSDKFAAAQDPRANHAAFEALQSQIAALAGRLEQSDANFSALVSLQNSVKDLFAYLDDTRHAADEAAQAAAARAAREAVRELIDQSGLIPANAGDDSAISREIGDLRVVQDEADRRTHATLNAVHETLEKIVDRLAMLEEEIAETQEAHASEQQAALQNTVLDRYREAAAARAPRNGEGLQDNLSADKPQRVRPSMPPSADFLIEPGTLFPNGTERTESKDMPSRARPAAASGDEPARSRSDFIAAARRAAQAAQAEQPDLAQQRIPMGEIKPPSRQGVVAQTRDFFLNHKRQLTLSVAALFLIAGAYAVVRTMGHLTVDVSADAPKTAVHTMADASSDSKLAALAPKTQHMQSDDAAASQTPPPGRPSDASPRTDAAAQSNLPMLAMAEGKPQNPITGSDPIVMNSIKAPLNTAIQPTDTPTALLALRAQAEAGHSAAQYELATRYAEGRAVPRDFKLAADWYEKAAAHGIVPAEYRLGSLYEKGLGVTRNLVQAKTWYEKAADQGHAHAMHNLAVLIAEGSDGKPDYAAAAVWFRKAAEFGIRDSQYNLAILLARGLGVQQDFVQSYVWFAAAAAQGDDDAGKKREDVAAKLDAKALAQAKAAAEAFHARDPDPAVNEVQPPSGGWEASVPAQTLPKLGKPKISRL